MILNLGQEFHVSKKHLYTIKFKGASILTGNRYVDLDYTGAELKSPHYPLPQDDLDKICKKMQDDFGGGQFNKRRSFIKNVLKEHNQYDSETRRPFKNI